MPFPLLAALVLGHKSAEDVLTHVRRALLQSNAQEILVEGKSKYQGADGDYKLRFAPDGKFALAVTGPLPESFGFDGKIMWKSDHTGAPRRLLFEDHDTTWGIELMMTDHWLDKSAPVSISVAPGTSGNQYTIHCVFAPFGLDETIAVDPKTWLPTSAKFSVAGDDVSIAVSDWNEVSGRKIPFHVEVSEGGQTDTFEVSKTTQSNTEATTSYSYPAWKAQDIDFDRSKPSLVESKKAISGHILVHPLVNGQDVGWFILDTGAEVMVIDPTVADKLQLSSLGQQTLTGVGGTVKSSFRRSSTFSLGPATLKNVIYSQLDLRAIGTALGVELAGVVGYDFFDRSIVTIDTVKPLVNIYDPTEFKLSRAQWSPIEFDTGNPAVQASLVGNRNGWFRLDTGDPGTVTFHTPYVEREHLLDGRTTQSAASGGVGGFVQAKTGSLEWFALGAHRFDNPQVTFSLAKVGALATPYLAGNIGQTFMSPFTMAFDFGGSRVAFIPKH